VSRGQSGLPVGLLREISRVFGIISLLNRKITFLDYSSTLRLGGMERCVCLSNTTSPTCVRRGCWLSMDQAPRMVKMLCLEPSVLFYEVST